MRPRPGALVGGRYELIELIATGGMGAVWEATDTTLHRPVAIKLLKPELSSDPTFLARFRAEARHSGSLSHPNIAAVYDYGETTDESGAVSAYLVMELVPGEPLSAVLNSHGALAPDRVLSIMRQVGSGLAAAHAAGIVHRDIKPGNLLLTPDGRIKITDFGIARAADSVPLTATGTVMGTARYLSPEQATGEAVVPASDIYSLGVVAYEGLAGRSPFDARGQVAQAMAHVHDDPRPLPDSIPGPVRALIARLLAKDPRDRPPNGASLVQAVDAAARGDDIGATTVIAPARDIEATQEMPTTDETAIVAARPAGYDRPTAQSRPAAPIPERTSAAWSTDSGPGVRASAAPSVTPSGSGGGRGRPRRRLTGPLIALILLVLFIAIGAALANGFGFGREQPVTSSTITVTSTPERTTVTRTASSSSSSSTTSSSSSSTSNTRTEPSSPEPTTATPTDGDTSGSEGAAGSSADNGQNSNPADGQPGQANEGS